MYDRDIGMVFQSYAIWPHMSVFENAAYPLRVAAATSRRARQVEERVTHVLTMVGLERFRARSATQLSGGQQQRLALARALVREPKLLAAGRAVVESRCAIARTDARRIEAHTDGLGRDDDLRHPRPDRGDGDFRPYRRDRSGQIKQIGAPRQIYEEPRSEFVANFIGRTNMLRGKLLDDVSEGGFGIVDTQTGAFRCRFTRHCAAAENVTFVTRPEHVMIRAKSDSTVSENAIAGRIGSEVYLGEVMEYTLETEAGLNLLIRTGAGSGPKIGDNVIVLLPPEKTIAVQAE